MNLLPAGAAETATSLLVAVFIAYAAARVGAEIGIRFGGVALVGEILAGAIVGPHVLGWIRDEPILIGLSELGVIVLLFAVGLETEFHALQRVGARGTTVGAVGIVLPFIAGAGLMWLVGEPTPTALFIGTALVATSVGITARVLEDLGLLGAKESLIILAAAVVDDVLGLLVLAAVVSIGQGGLDMVGLALLIVETIVFFAVALTVARVGIQRHGRKVRKLRSNYGALASALVLCLGLGALAGTIGLAAIVGAFLAGLLVAELSDELQLKRDLEPIRAFLVPFFFVMTGAHFDFRALLDPAAIGIGVALTVLAIVTKLIGCGLAMWGTSLSSAVRVGVGMVPRGEVGLVVASLGLAAGVIDATLYAAVLMMVAVTTLIAPLILPRAYAFRAARPA